MPWRPQLTMRKNAMHFNYTLQQKTAYSVHSRLFTETHTHWAAISALLITCSDMRSPYWIKTSTINTVTLRFHFKSWDFWLAGFFLNRKFFHPDPLHRASCTSTEWPVWQMDLPLPLLPPRNKKKIVHAFQLCQRAVWSLCLFLLVVFSNSNLFASTVHHKI